VNPLETRRESDEVFYATGVTVPVSHSDVSVLKEKSTQTSQRRTRLCAHENPDSLLHEMIIVHEAGTYVRPHKHLGKSESIHLIEGELDLVGFDQEGRIIQVVPMGVYASGSVFYHRIPEDYIHTLLIKTNIVFHEVTQGPFRRPDTVFPDWAPEESEQSAVDEFHQVTRDACNEHRRASDRDADK
jgi:cupin fold WbuC family metalloprotein